MKPYLRVVLALFALISLVAAGCGDDDESGEDATEASSDSGGSGDETTPGLDPEFVELFQTQLAAIGCYDGTIDGIDGPATTAAIVNFQRAQGLTEDGVVGPETEGALVDAVEAGIEGCTADGSDDGDTGNDSAAGGDNGPTVTVDSPQYGKEFEVTSCDNPGETTLALTAEADDIVLQIDATDGVGTLFISGGNEQDGVDLAGTVTAVTVGDAGNLTVEGTFDSDDGQAFTISGSCAGA